MITSLLLSVALAGAAPAHSADECAVWRREASFARSVDQHDAAAFAAHLHPGAVFNVGAPLVHRGRDAVLAEWAGLIAGEGVVLRWRPQFVNIGGEPDIASSSGPYLLQRQGADGQPEYAAGRFASVWKKAADGEWYVLFDSGNPPRPVSAEQAAALFDDLPGECVPATTG